MDNFKKINTPLVSVILPNFNNEKYLNQSINSVIAQTFVNWELFIIDDASSDNSLKIINKYKKNKNILSVIPVHLSGYAAHSEEIYKVCKKNKIYVIEDAAHSFGAKYNKKYGCDYDYKNYGGGIDQLQNIIDEINKSKETGESSRRMIMSAWNREQLDEMALPPCHVLSQYH